MTNYKFDKCGNYTFQCYITYNGMTFYGEAKCHPDDYDMCSDRTGYFIAEARANIAKLRYCRDHEIMPMVKQYRHFYDCVSHSTHFNTDSYEAQAIRREWNRWEKQLLAIKEDIKHEKEYLNLYMTEKEKLYNRIRKGKSN